MYLRNWIISILNKYKYFKFAVSKIFHYHNKLGNIISSSLFIKSYPYFIRCKSKAYFKNGKIIYNDNEKTEHFNCQENRYDVIQKNR